MAPSSRGAPATSGSCSRSSPGGPLRRRIGPTPVPEAIGHCTEIRRAGPRAARLAVAQMLPPFAVLHAMQGDFDVARSLVREANAILGSSGGCTAVGLAHPEASRRDARRPSRWLPRNGSVRGVRPTRRDGREGTACDDRGDARRRRSTRRVDSTRRRRYCRVKPELAARRGSLGSGRMARSAGEDPRAERSSTRTRKRSPARQSSSSRRQDLLPIAATRSSTSPRFSVPDGRAAEAADGDFALDSSCTSRRETAFPQPELARS